MLQRAAIICGLVLVSGCATGGHAGTDAAKLTATEKMVWSTYAIGTHKGLATCVVVKRNNPRLYPVLITSAHVLAVAPRGPFFIATRLPGDDGNPIVSLMEFRPSPDAEPAYVRHPVYDIAAIEVPIPPELAAELTLPSFIHENAIVSSTEHRHVGDDVSVLGFPKIYPGTVGAFPVLRGGRVASYSVPSQSNAARFLINANVYPGDSGAPVFAAHSRGVPPLLGIITERIGPLDGAVPLAVAIDSSAVRETLQLLNAREGRLSLSRQTSARTTEPQLPTPPTIKMLGTRESWKHIAPLPVPVRAHP